MDAVKHRLKSFFIKVVVAVSGVMLIALRNEVSAEISKALTLCADVLIPSLFPFMVLSAFAVSVAYQSKKNRIIAFIMSRIFRLPYAAFSAVIFGFLGGYPVGGRVISALYEKGSISSKDARHLFSFCVNAGPAFIVSVAGGVVTGSVTAGYAMFSAVVMSSFVVGVLYARMRRKTADECVCLPEKKITVGDSLVSAVTGSAYGILAVCGWVIAFSAFSVTVKFFLSESRIFGLYLSLSEITSGVYTAVSMGGLPFMAACISFGGLSVLCQLLPEIKKCGIKVYEYLFFRIVNSILSYFVTSLIMRFVDISIPTVSQYEAQLHFAPASAMLLVMCAVLIADLASVNRKKTGIFG